MTIPTSPGTNPARRGIAVNEPHRASHVWIVAQNDLFAFAYPKSTWQHAEPLTVTTTTTLLSLMPFTLSEPLVTSPTLTIDVRATDCTVTVTDGTATATITCGATEETQTATLAVLAINTAITVTVQPRSGQPSGDLVGIYIRETPLTSGQLP
jgi:hypothetical protein